MKHGEMVTRAVSWAADTSPNSEAEAQAQAIDPSLPRLQTSPSHLRVSKLDSRPPLPRHVGDPDHRRNLQWPHQRTPITSFHSKSCCIKHDSRYGGSTYQTIEFELMISTHALRLSWNNLHFFSDISDVHTHRSESCEHGSTIPSKERNRGNL
jgi:hypothetical protein